MAEIERPSTSPAAIALVSGGVSTVLTIAATLVSLRTDATRADLFLVLTWVMFVAAAATVIALMWSVSSTLLLRLRQLASAREIEAHVSRNIRIRKIHHHLVYSSDGDCKYTVECDVEADPAAAVPWMAFPLFGAAPVDAEPWQSVRLVRLLVDDDEFAVDRFYVKRRRSRIEGNELFRGLVCEEGIVRVPVSLEKGRSKCKVLIEVDFDQSSGRFPAEESHSTDISYITDELDVHITGRGGFEIFFSPHANHPVEASQNGGEMIDNHESGVQSRTCYRTGGIRWHSKTVKLGYRYEIKYVGRLAATS